MIYSTYLQANKSGYARTYAPIHLYIYIYIYIYVSVGYVRVYKKKEKTSWN